MKHEWVPKAYDPKNKIYIAVCKNCKYATVFDLKTKEPMIDFIKVFLDTHTCEEVTIEKTLNE